MTPLPHTPSIKCDCQTLPAATTQLPPKQIALNTLEQVRRQIDAEITIQSRSTKDARGSSDKAHHPPRHTKPKAEATVAPRSGWKDVNYPALAQTHNLTRKRSQNEQDIDHELIHPGFARAKQEAKRAWHTSVPA